MSDQEFDLMSPFEQRMWCLNNPAQAEMRLRRRDSKAWDAANPIKKFRAPVPVKPVITSDTFAKILKSLAASWHVDPEKITDSTAGRSHHPARIELIFQCIEAGMSHDQIADNLGVAAKRIYMTVYAVVQKSRINARRLQRMAERKSA